MSPRNQVVRLSCLCLKSISTQLIYLLSDEEGKNQVAVKQYLSDATYEVLQDLLNDILATENLDAATRFSCLQVLLRHDVKKLNTGTFPHSYYEDILEEIQWNGTGLQHLNLKGVWVRNFPELLSATLSKLKNLKALTIPHMANDEVLESVMELKELTALDISGEAAFSADGLRKIRSDKITVLDIGYYGKQDICTDESSSCELVADVLENLPNLNILRTYSFTGAALSKLYTRKRDRKTKLKYIHDTGTSLETIEAVINTCPDLESVYIDKPADGVVSNLSGLKKIHSLKVSKFNWKELLNYLGISGSHLQVLKLNSCKDTVIDLSQICYAATNLITMECYKLDLTFSQPDSYFMNLQSLELLHCNLNTHTLRCLMVNSPFLRRIVVGDVVQFTDGDVFRLCAECDFVNLEELWFSCARCLTATSVELLMGHCPSLKTIGQLSGWGVGPAEVEFFRAVILSNNINLTLFEGNFL